jgi:hypothetical protein
MSSVHDEEGRRTASDAMRCDAVVKMMKSTYSRQLVMRVRVDGDYLSFLLCTVWLPRCLGDRRNGDGRVFFRDSDTTFLRPHNGSFFSVEMACFTVRVAS